MNSLSSINLKTCAPNSENQDQFREVFKYFKSKNSAPDFSKVLDFHYCSNKNVDIQPIEVDDLPPELEYVRKGLALKPPKEWNIYSLHHHPGLMIICNAFTEYGTLFWIKRCLQQFSGHPYKTNLSNLGLCSKDTSWWQKVKCPLSRNQNSELISQLRWATMGYHHNWDTKEYSDSEWSPMPDDLEDLCKLFLYAVDHSHAPNFKAEAAIVNYYPSGSTLSPYTDHSEPFKEAPLLSFSFGRSGVFLIGGREKNTAPTPLFLHHGDVMIMSGYSRLCYHAVPRILSDGDVAPEFEVHKQLYEFIDTFRALIRPKPRETNHENRDKSLFSQVLSILFSEDGSLSDIKRMKAAVEFCDRNRLKYSDNITSRFCSVFDSNYEEFEAVLNYIKTVRINMNVRQVKPSNPS